MNVYEKAEAYIRERLAGRRILENCVRLGDFIARKHGPHLRVFAIPSEALAEDEVFVRRVGLSRSQIRTATEALIEIGFLNRLSPERTDRRKKDRPVRYELGDEIAALFPASQIASCKTQGFIIRTLVVEEATTRPRPAARQRTFAPMPPHQRSADMRVEQLRGLPVPKLSALALATRAGGHPGQFPGSRMQSGTAHWRPHARDGAGRS